MKRISDSAAGVLCALGSQILFGFSFIFTRSAAGSAGMFALLGWRFALAAVAMTLPVIAGVFRIDLKNRPLRPLMRIALCSPILYYIGETLGIRLTTATESGVFLSAIPVFSLIASALILRKKPVRLQIIGICLTLIGVLATVFAVSASASLSVPGYACLMLAVLSYVFYSVCVDRAKDYSGIEITFVMLWTGAIVFGGIALIESIANGHTAELLALPFTDGAFRAAILYQGIGCSILAFILTTKAIAGIGMTRMASFIGVSTVVSIFAGVLILREPFTFWQAAGSAIILIGVYTANIKKG